LRVSYIIIIIIIITDCNKLKYMTLEYTHSRFLENSRSSHTKTERTVTKNQSIFFSEGK